MSTPTQQPAPDFGEPWQNELGDFEIYSRTNGAAVAYAEGPKTRDRIIAAMNACAGMVDPAAEIQAMRLAAPVWQPIETAPKDGTVILLGFITLPVERLVYEGRWNDVQDTWTTVNGFGLLTGATHWTPLPTPPQV